MGKSIYKLELHDEVSIYGSENRDIQVLRVPGGWIYKTSEIISDSREWAITETFVPFNNEFMPGKNV